MMSVIVSSNPTSELVGYSQSSLRDQTAVNHLPKMADLHDATNTQKA
jgi:hypothetical protein